MVKVAKCCHYIFPIKYNYCPYHGKKLKDIQEKEFMKLMLTGDYDKNPI